MDWQLSLAVLTVSVSAIYVGRQTWRSWFANKSGGCGAGCCGKPPAKPGVSSPRIIPVEELTLRIRARS